METKKYNARNTKKLQESDHDSEYKNLYKEYLNNFHNGFKNFEAWINGAPESDLNILIQISEEHNINSNIPLEPWYNELIKNNII